MIFILATAICLGSRCTMCWTISLKRWWTTALHSRILCCLDSLDPLLFSWKPFFVLFVRICWGIEGQVGMEQRVSVLENFTFNGAFIFLILCPVSQHHMNALQKAVLENSVLKWSTLSYSNIVIVQQYKYYRVCTLGELRSQAPCETCVPYQKKSFQKLLCFVPSLADPHGSCYFYLC